MILAGGPLGGTYVTGWSPTDGTHASYKKRPQRAPLLLPCENTEGAVSESGGGLSADRICWHLDPSPPSFQKCEKYNSPALDLVFYDGSLID